MMIYVMFHKFANGQGKFFDTDGMSGISGLVPHPGTTWSWFRIELFVSPGANFNRQTCSISVGPVQIVLVGFNFYILIIFVTI